MSTTLVQAGLAIGRRVGLSGFALAVTYAILAVAAALPSPALFLAGALASYVVDWWLHQDANRAKLFGIYRLPPALRFLVRQTLVLLLLIRLDLATPTVLAWFVAAQLAVYVGYGVQHGLRSYATRLRPCRFAWLRLAADTLPPEWPEAIVPWPRLFNGDPVRTHLHADLPLVLGFASLGLGLPASAVPGLAVATALLAAVVPVVVAARLPKLRRLPDQDEVLSRLLDAINALGTEVAVHFSGPRGTTYQLNVWLPTLNRSRRPTLIILREKHHLIELADTDLPVVVLPRGEDIIENHIPSLRAVLFPANITKNNDMVRVAGLRTALILHGDSDKASSVTPTSRMYDEIWVAGEAGRARFARVREGFRPEQVEVVGRPQVAEIQRSTPGATTGHETVTVLYAPTWEGFYEESDYSSLPAMGERIVRDLLETDRQVRVLFKAHPATGTRVREHAVAVERICELIDAAGNGSRTVGDIDGLYAAFNEADLLVTDVSSVASDFLWSAKPLVVTNPRGLDDTAFLDEFPSTMAAYRITPDDIDAGATLELALGEDPLTDVRTRMRRHLLGDLGGDPVERFLDAVDRLVERNHYAGPVIGLQRLGAVRPDEPASARTGGAAR